MNVSVSATVSAAYFFFVALLTGRDVKCATSCLISLKPMVASGRSGMAYFSVPARS